MPPFVLPRRELLGCLAASGLAMACVPSSPTPATTPLPRAAYDFTPTPCEQPGSTKLTLAVVAPRWQNPAAASSQVVYSQGPVPGVMTDLTTAMRGDFLELATCLGYLTRGPFDSFESMVFPDREASQLLLEPELLMNMAITNMVAKQGSIISIGQTGNQITGSASVGGRISLTLKEPVTNTRMWTKSIEVPSETFAFISEKKYLTASMTEDIARRVLLEDAGLLRPLLPKLEAIYRGVFTTAQSYLNAREVATVATQAAAVKKRAAVAVPPE